nr:hypothetical protein [Tanacetum cinerariifolium]
MTTPITTNGTDSQMHNNIMAVGSRDRPPMLTPGRYAQWRSRFMRYIDTKDNEVNKIRAEKIAKNANPLALVAATQQYPGPYYQAPKPQRSYAPAPEQYSSTRSNVSTKNKGKEIAKRITSPSESAFKEESDPEQAQKDKDMHKNLALIAKKFVISLRSAGNQKRDTDEEIDEQELEAHYSYMVKIQEVPTADSGTDIEPLKRYLVQGNITINRVYSVKGLNHNLFSTGQFCDADLEVAFWKTTCFVRDLQGSDLLTVSSTQAWLFHQRRPYLNFNYINLLSKKDIMIGLPKLKYVKDQLCSSCELSTAKRSSFKIKAVSSLKGRLNLIQIDLCGPMRVESINGKKYILEERNRGSMHHDTTTPSQQELDLLFGPLYDEFFTAVTLSVNKSFSPTDNSTKQDTQPITNIYLSTEPKTPTTTDHAEENNDNQAKDAHFKPYEFVNLFCTPVGEEAETSSRNVDILNMHTFYQPHQSKHRWIKDYPFTQVRENPSKPVQTRRQLVIDPEMCMFMLTVSTVEPKNIKEAMANSTWIEAMQDELYQFDRLQV